jgi:predicted PurR-regulated permease PerM
MLGIDRRAASYAWTVAVTFLLLFLVYSLRRTLFVFTLALLFAYLLSPLVNLLVQVLPIRTRTVALGLAYVIFIGVAAFVIAQVGERVVEQATNLVTRFPVMLAAWEHPSPGAPHLINSLKLEIIERVQTQIAENSSSILSMLSTAGLKAISLATNLGYVVLVPILAFFFLKDGALIRNHIVELFPEGPRRVLLEDLMADLHLLLVHYMRALVVLSLSTFAAYTICFLVLGVPYAVLLAVLAGMLEFIPMLGPLTAGVAITAVTALAGAPVLVVIIFLLAYRTFQDYILSPHLMHQGIQLHPLLVLFGVFAGAEVAGIAGSFLSVPVLALVRVMYVRLRKARAAAKLLPVEPLPEKVVI